MANMPIGDQVHLNGRLVPFSEAHISPLDRGFLFAHAAYEVTAVYNGKFIDLDGHLLRLARTLEGIALPNPHSDAEWARIHQELIDANGIREGLVYLQVTGGAYEARDFAGPETFEPTVFLYADAKPLIGQAAEHGIAAIFMHDTRWARRDMKTVQLLSQALAYRAAKQAGADTAFLVQDGHVTEAASANAWIVNDSGRLITRNLSTDILPGITRSGVLRLIDKTGLEIEERAFTPDEALNATEAFTTSAGAMIAPVIMMEGQPVGAGKPGPVTRKVQKAYYEAIGADVASVAPWVLA
ncbi:hypothetical protein HY29_10110 [Hyphomonas beringensis]|uniref:Probable branched-chain-amino-acid aminotransferase n=1 Tax=Hyphomonas beringensis TaxID=1280946 RepID=A0A062UII4_9PROT|nr:aminotransferase class IV [Hyphomonas beringensis]KCZ55950.1 hypothetical protein HY29_10110 [Hyphomonas beringensis]